MRELIHHVADVFGEPLSGEVALGVGDRLVISATMTGERSDTGRERSPRWG